MAAIPDTGGARYAPRGVMRALLRIVVLGGLLIAGWLLGSGTSHADEDLGLPITGLVANGAPSDGGSDGQFGIRPTVASTVTRVLSTASVPLLPAPPPATVGIVKSVGSAIGASKPVSKVLAPMARPTSGSTTDGTAVRSQAPAHGAPSGVREQTATAPVPAPGPATVLSTPAHPIAAIFAIDAPPTRPFVGPSAPSSLVGQNDPAPPIPANLPETATAPCLSGSAGGGAGTKCGPDFAVNDTGAMGALAATHPLLNLDASDLPRSPATQPSTSPD